MGVEINKQIVLWRNISKQTIKIVCSPLDNCSKLYLEIFPKLLTVMFLHNPDTVFTQVT